MTDDQQMTRAMALQDRLETLTGDSTHDMLCAYRRWLDANQIPAETDGWPSENAYDEGNIQAFVNEWGE